MPVYGDSQVVQLLHLAECLGLDGANGIFPQVPVERLNGAVRRDRKSPWESHAAVLPTCKSGLCKPILHRKNLDASHMESRLQKCLKIPLLLQN